MTDFAPSMHNRIDGFSVVHGPRRHIWNGIVADLWDVNCEAGAGGYYVADHPRLFIALETEQDEAGRFRLTDERTRAVKGYMAPNIAYIPAQMEVWAYMENACSIRHLDLHFSIDMLSQRLKEDLVGDRLSDPRFFSRDERMLALARLIATECENPDPLHTLYGDSLTTALLIDLMKLGRTTQHRRTPLAAWQLRRAKEFIEANCLRRIRLEELADITGLSQSHFSHSFKASTGIPPYKWQMQARIERVKSLLLDPDMTLTETAVTAGFADQAHFTRVFRKMVGMTPLTWQREHRH